MASRERMAMMRSRDGGEEKNAFERFEQEVKSTVYGIMFLMLKTEQESFLQLVIFMVIEACQLFSLVFNPFINFPWKGYEVGSYLEGFLQVFQIAYWCTFLDWASYLIIFYIGVGIVVLVVIDIVYAAYTLSSKKVAVMWPLKILRSVFSLLVTVLFMPFIDLFTSMMQCSVQDGVLSHQAFSSVHCWKDLHILHAVSGIIACGVFTAISLVVVLTMFETRSTSNDPSARIHARNEFAQNSFKFVCILATTFFISDSYRWALIVLLLTGSILLYMKNRNDKPYYHEMINRMQDVMNGLFMWSCFCLVIVMLSEDSDFNGGMQIFLMSLPLIGIMIVTKRDRRSALLLKDIEDVESPADWYLKIRHYITIVLHKDIDRESSVQLNGFIFHHEEACGDATCPIKVYTSQVLASLKEKKKKQSKSGTESFGLLMGYANQLFTLGVTKFPLSSTLHIAYALFLKDRMNNKSNAINELAAAERSNPSFDEQFLIFRYRKILEDEMAEIQEGGGAVMDVVTMLAYENYLQQFREAIERSACLHMEFWIELLEPEPDLGKLDETGIKINNTMVVVQDHWEKLQKLNPNSPKALKMYADYLIDVLNDAEEAEELLSRIKDTEFGKYLNNSMADAEALGMGDICATMGGADGTPCVVVSGEQGKLGEIFQFNMSTCRLFGYTKAEMLGRKVGVLMPDLYAKLHDGFLQRGINSAEDMGVTTTKTEKFVLGKHKSGYLIPLPLTARVVISVKQGSFFVGVFKNEKRSLNVVYLLLDEHQDIVGVSSKGISILHLTNHILKSYRVSAQTLAPGITDKSLASQIASRNGGTLDFFLPEMPNQADSTALNLSLSQHAIISADSAVAQVEAPSKKLRLNASRKSLKVNCIMTEQSFNGHTHGYILRVEPVDDVGMAGRGHKIEAEPRYPNFQFVFDPIEMKYVQQDCEEDAQRLIAEETSSYVNILRDRSDRSLTPEKSDESRVDTSMMAPHVSKAEDISRIQLALEGKRKEYGEGVETYRLIDGRREKINVEKNRLLERQREEQREIEEAHARALFSAGARDDMYSILKSKKVFMDALNDRSVPSSVQKLKYTGYVIVLILLTLASTEFGLVVTQLQDIEENISLVRDSYFQIVAQMRAVYYIGKIVLLMKSVEPVLRSSSSSRNEVILECKKRVEESLSEYYEVQDRISLSKIGIMDGHKDLFDSKCVYLYYTNTSLQQSSDKYYTLPEAIQQMASEIFTIVSITDYQKYEVGNDDVFFALYNGFADLLEKMEASARFFVEELKDRGESKVKVVIALFSVSLAVLAISILVLFPVVWGVSGTRLSVLLLFFDIPLSTIRELEHKCERFAAQSKDENIEVLSISDSNPLLVDRPTKDEGPITITGSAQAHKRRFKNNTTSNHTFYFYFIIAVLILAGYFAFNFGFGFVFLRNIAGYSRELNATAESHSKITHSISVFQNFLGHRRIFTLSESQTFDLLASREIAELNSITQETQNSHNEYMKTFTEKYQNAFIDIMRNNVCLYSTTFSIPFNCETFPIATVKEGLHPVIINFIESVKEMLTQHKGITSQNITLEEQNKIISDKLLNSEMFSNLEKAIFDIVDPALRYLLRQVQSSYESQLSTELTQRIVMFIVFILCFLIAYLAFWAPFITRLCNEIWRTRSMLTLIPYDICKNIRSIKEFLSQQAAASSDS